MSGNERIAERIARTEAQKVPLIRPAHHEDDTEVVVVGAGPAGPARRSITAT